MKARLRTLSLVSIAVLAAWAAPPHVHAQSAAAREACERDFLPHVGQGGKDVVWVPTPDELVVAMLEAAGTRPEDVVYDLGAGDGKIVITAAKKFGATGVGVEYDPKMVELAQCLADAEGVDDKVKIVQGDIFQTDFSDASVIALYLLPTLNERLRPRILEMEPGTRVVSHSFRMGEWMPDQQIEVGSTHAYLWIVPAKVEGSWRFFPEADASAHEGQLESLSLDLDQHYQQLRGTVNDASGERPVQGELNGAAIALRYSDAEGRTIRLSGTVIGEEIHVFAERPSGSLRLRGKRI